MSTVKIVSITKPLITKSDGTPMNANEFIAYCARVSNPSNQMNTETSEKLLKYCIRNKHWSIFEMVNIVMMIETTRDIARQIIRHRSFSFQEFSQRYADPTQDLGFVIREARLQDNKNRQNSIETENQELQETWQTMQSYVRAAAKDAYKWAIENGIAKEQARAVLPEGLTISRMYMNGTLRSWIHFIQVRGDKTTQKEHRLIAEECKKIILEYFPFLRECLDV